MPKVFAAMRAEDRAGIKLTQQVRAENMEAVSSAYRAMSLDCELNPFFMDMPRRIAASHLVVCRSGASTIAELGVIGRPAVMVPLPHALDNDQLRCFGDNLFGMVRVQGLGFRVQGLHVKGPGRSSMQGVNGQSGMCHYHGACLCTC